MIILFNDVPNTVFCSSGCQPIPFPLQLSSFINSFIYILLMLDKQNKVFFCCTFILISILFNWKAKELILSALFSEGLPRKSICLSPLILPVTSCILPKNQWGICDRRWCTDVYGNVKRKPKPNVSSFWKYINLHSSET